MTFLQRSFKIYVTPIRWRVRRRGKGTTATAKKSPNYNFITTGQSPYSKQLTDVTEENVDFIREEYISRMITNPLKNSDATVESVEWQPHLKRCGVVGMKLGFSVLFDKEGQRIWTTAIHLADTQVISSTPISDSEISITIGCNNISPEWLTEKQMKVYQLNGVPCKERIHSFIVNKEANIFPGTKLSANHFTVGQFVDVNGRSIDRGFQGAMKRWDFHGLPATHGVTLSHRSLGSTGTQGANRVLPGKRMHGQMGDKVIFMRGCQILRINTVHDILYVKGAFPGLRGSFLVLRDTSILTKKTINPPFPTFVQPSEKLPEDIYADSVHPFEAPSVTYEPIENS